MATGLDVRWEISILIGKNPLTNKYKPININTISIYIKALNRLKIPYGVYLYSYAENQQGTVSGLGTAYEAELDAKRIVREIKLLRYFDHDNIVSLYDNYFHDLLIEKQGNTILFTLPFPVEEELSNLTLRELLAYYIQIFNDRLPYETTTEERHDILEGIKETIQKKYNIYIDVDMNGKINLTNVSGDFEDLLDK